MNCEIPGAVSLTHATLAMQQGSFLRSLTFPDKASYTLPSNIDSTDVVIELSIAPGKNAKLVPNYTRKDLFSRGIDLENFVPLSPQEMKAQLD